MTFEDEQRVRRIIQEELSTWIMTDRFVFQKHLQLFDGKNIQVGNGTGSSFGTESTQKISLYGETPVIQASAIASPTGGGSGVGDAIDLAARQAIDLIRTALTNIGITA